MGRLGYVVAICLAVLVSCGKVDFEKIETGKPYTGLYGGRKCVVMIDSAEAGNMKGRIYLDNGEAVADPIPFTSELKKSGKGKLWIQGQKKSIVGIAIEGDTLKGELDKEAFTLSLYQEPELPYRSQYVEPYYDVAVKQNVVYKKDVKGYWSSYPDTGDTFVNIYLGRAGELTSKDKLKLEMDIYSPKGKPKGELCPLLILIHGGAFYNGDKQDLGFPEMGRHFAKRGYVVASINYRLGFMLMAADVDRAGYRALQDTHAAVCYLIGKAKDYNIDTNKIYAAGASAGAITALNLAFMRDEDRPKSTKAGGILGWLSSTLLKDLEIDSDLGPINAVSSPHSHPFEVKAVINMWGAVNKIDMLRNSRRTAILSFHGDADRIVPIAYGYPFDKVLESYVDTLINGLPKLIRPVAEMGRDLYKKGKPFNEWAFNPVYGSSEIHNKAKSLGMRSELHTVEGGKHSLQKDEQKALSSYFNDTILPTATRFLCRETVGGKMVRLVQIGSWVNALDADNVAELRWQVKGGAVIGKDDKKVKVLFFGDAPKHSVIAGGKYKNGIEFRETIQEGRK